MSPETKQIVGPAVLARLRPGAILVNTSRGELIDHAALAEAVRTRGLRVGLDVFEQEPDTATATFHDPVAQLPGVYGTHHIGASTSQAQEAIAAETVRIVRAFAETGRVPNVVNLARRTPATHMLVVRHHDRPGVLAHIFGHLRERSLNVQETENIVFEGALAAVARINLDKAPDAALLDSLRASPDVLDLQVVPCSRNPVSGVSQSMPTTVQRIFNFSAGPAVMPSPSSRRRSATSSRCPASACRSWRSATGRRRSNRSSTPPKPTSAPSPASPTTTRCCSSRAAPACSSRWCR